jgi:hypothetical protein
MRLPLLLPGSVGSRRSTIFWPTTFESLSLRAAAFVTSGLVPLLMSLPEVVLGQQESTHEQAKSANTTDLADVWLTAEGAPGWQSAPPWKELNDKARAAIRKLEASINPLSSERGYPGEEYTSLERVLRTLESFAWLLSRPVSISPNHIAGLVRQKQESDHIEDEYTEPPKLAERRLRPDELALYQSYLWAYYWAELYPLLEKRVNREIGLGLRADQRALQRSWEEQRLLPMRALAEQNFFTPQLYYDFFNQLRIEDRFETVALIFHAAKAFPKVKKTSFEAAQNYQNIINMNNPIRRYLIRILGLDFVFGRFSKLIIDPKDPALPSPDELVKYALNWVDRKFSGSPTIAMARISGESSEAERALIANWIIGVDPNLSSLSPRDKSKFEILLRRFVQT